MWQQLVDYFKANPVIFGVVCGAVLLIVIAVIALCVKGAKAKKAIQAVPAPTPAEETQLSKPTQACETELQEVVETPIEPTPCEQPQAEQSTDAQAEEQAQEPTTAQSAPQAPIQASTAVKEEKAEAPATAPQTPKAKTKKVATEKKTVKSNATVPKSEGTKTEMKQTFVPVYEEDETEKAAKYSGKWVICRVLSADETDSQQTEELYFFELHASNGERLLSSEEYTSYNGALGGIETHKANILKDNFRITLSKKGDYIFKLMSGKNMLLCMGEHYATKARCESAIESTKRFAKTAVIDENVQDIVVTPPQEDDSDIAPPAEGYNGKWIVSSNIGADGEEVYYFELFASNGEKLLSSEEYTTYVGAINGIGTHKANIQKGNFRITLTKHGNYIYKLLSGNGQLLCLGEHYKTKRRCLSAVESVKRFALNAPVLTDSKNTNRE